MMTDLGFSLPHIAATGDADEYPEEALRTLDAELANTIERLQRVRVELVLILRQATPTDLPAELASATAHESLSDADRAFIAVVTRVLSPSALNAYTEMLKTTPGPRVRQLAGRRRRADPARADGASDRPCPRPPCPIPEAAGCGRWRAGRCEVRRTHDRRCRR